MDVFSDDLILDEVRLCALEIRERTQVAQLRADSGLREAHDAVTAVLECASQVEADGAPTQREIVVLEDTLARHDVLLDDFVHAVAETTQSQVELERRAHAHTSEVHTISRAMARAASSSRLVAINALINANALESGQATLAALAQEMQQLSGVVQASSADVDAVANRLGVILPALNQCVSQIAAATELFAEQVGERRATVRASVDDLDDSLAAARSSVEDLDTRKVRLNDALHFDDVVMHCFDVLTVAADVLEHAAEPLVSA